MIVYNPFHSIGLFSVFDTDLMRNADIYLGGFGAQYVDEFLLSWISEQKTVTKID